MSDNNNSDNNNNTQSSSTVSNTGESVVRATRKKSNIWQHFEKIDSSGARCKICLKQFKIKYSNTSSLLRHLKSIHNGTVNNSTRSNEAGPSAVPTTSNITYLDKNSSRAKELTNGIARMIGMDFQPYSIVEDVGFCSLLRIAETRYEIPSRTTFSRVIIPKLYEDLKHSFLSLP